MVTNSTLAQKKDALVDCKKLFKIYFCTILNNNARYILKTHCVNYNIPVQYYAMVSNRTGHNKLINQHLRGVTGYETRIFKIKNIQSHSLNIQHSEIWAYMITEHNQKRFYFPFIPLNYINLQIYFTKLQNLVGDSSAKKNGDIHEFVSDVCTCIFWQLIVTGFFTQFICIHS